LDARATTSAAGGTIHAVVNRDKRVGGTTPVNHDDARVTGSSSSNQYYLRPIKNVVFDFL
jgi:hypothetical protein